MASFDPTTNTVVARILYDGLGMAGKTRSLRRVQEYFSTRSGAIYVPEERKGRTLYFDWLELDAGWFEEHPLKVQLVTVPGQWVYVQRRWSLLQSPDAIIGVVDSTPEGVHRATYAMRFLRAALAQAAEQSGAEPAPLLVQANKQDLPDAARGDVIRERLALGDGVPIIEASAETGQGIREVLVRAIQGAREHIRRTLKGAPLTSLPINDSDPERIYEHLRRAETERGDSLEGEMRAEQVLAEDEKT